MLIRRVSLFSGKEHERDIPVTFQQLEAWSKGVAIQEAMPSLSADDREFLISGSTPEEWKEATRESEEQAG